MIPPLAASAALCWLFSILGIAALGPPGSHPLSTAGLFLAAFAFMVILARRFPDDLDPLTALVVVALIGLAGRALLLGFPVGNDLYRYVWEGYIQQYGFNPYRYAPDHPDLARLLDENIRPLWQQVNHRDFTAVYPPLAMLLFKGLAALTTDPFGFKLGLLAFDLGTGALLALIVRERRLPVASLLFYFANPLVVVYIAGEGHMDSLQEFFLVLAVYLFLKGRGFAVFFSLGLAVMSKYTALAVLPFILNRNNWKKAPAGLLPLLLFVPYIDAGSGLFASLHAFGAQMHYNDALTSLLRLFVSESAAAAAAALVLAASLTWIYLFVPDTLTSVYLAVGATLLCLPTLHPWYLVMIAPFLVFFPSSAWIYLQAAVVLTFPVLAAEIATGRFQEMHWIKFLEYGPFIALLIYGRLRSGRLMPCTRVYRAPRSVSVIIPALNEAGRIERCIEAVRQTGRVDEIVVADGGSTDGTPELAAAAGASVVNADKGRGLQIHRGVERASRDLLLVLHADCKLHSGTIDEILAALAARPCAAGGGVGMRFEKQTVAARLVAFLNNLRLRLTGIAFGDQAQFFRKEALPAVGGFPQIMLMEDVEMSLRLKQAGRTVFVGRGVQVSGRRWRGGGFAGKVTLVLRLFLRFLLERRWYGGARLNRDYYARYYAVQSRRARAFKARL